MALKHRLSDDTVGRSTQDRPLDSKFGCKNTRVTDATNNAEPRRG